MPEIHVVTSTGDLVDRAAFLPGDTFASAAMRRWPDGWPECVPLVYDRDRHLLSEQAATERPMEPDDLFYVCLYPKGPVAGVIAAVGAYLSTVSVGTWVLLAVSLAAALLFQPKLPDAGNLQSSQYKWKDGDRPQFLTAQNNRLRPGERTPELFGLMRLFPDLISNAFVEYSGQNQYIRQIFCITNGWAEIANARLSEEGIEETIDYTVAVYHPGDTFPVDFPITRESTFVGSIDLVGPNELDEIGLTFTISGNSVTASLAGYFKDFDAIDLENWFMLDAPGLLNANRIPQKLVSITNNDTTINLKYAMTAQSGLTNLQYRGISKIDTNSSGNPRVYDISAWGMIYLQAGGSGGGYYFTEQYKGTSSPEPDAKLADKYSYLIRTTDRKKQKFSGITSRLTGNPPSGSPGLGFLAHEDFDRYTGDFWAMTWSNIVGYAPEPELVNPDEPGFNATGVLTVPGDQTTSIMYDFQFDQGLYKQEAGKNPQQTAVTIRVGYRLVNTTGAPNAWTIRQVKYTAKTRNPRRYTFRVNVPSGKYETYIERLTDYTEPSTTITVIDSVRLVRLQSIQTIPELYANPLTHTLVEVGFSTQNNALQGVNLRFNCLAQRYLPDYENNDPATLVATRKVGQAIAYTLADQAGYSTDQIDWDKLWEIQADLDAIDSDGSSGMFNGLIDRPMSAEDQVATLGAVGRIQAYRKSSYIGFSRAKAGMLPTTLINGRNKVEPEQRVMSFPDGNTPDAITVRFLDITNDYHEETIQYPDEATVQAQNPVDVVLLGVVHPRVAWRLAKQKFDSQTQMTQNIVVNMTEEGVLLDPLEVVSITDHLREQPPLDGEVLNVDPSDAITFDQSIPAGTYQARLRDEYGSIYNSQQIVIGTGGPVQTVPGWGSASVPDNEDASVGLLYSFTPIATDHQTLFSVGSVAVGDDRTVTLSANEYNDAQFAADTEEPPYPLPTATAGGTIV